MQKKHNPIAVSSRTFSKHQQLRNELSQKFDNVTFNDSGKNLQGNELIEFLSNKEGAIVALEKIDESILSKITSLKVISKYGVGIDNLDLDALKKYNIQLGWSGGVNRRSVSELTLSFILNLIRGTHNNSNQVKAGTWKYDGGAQLSEKTVGIIGCGYIGKDLVEILKPFKCKILVNDIQSVDTYCKQNGLVSASKEEIYQTADIITLHVPATDLTKDLINAKSLSMMKKEAILVNTSRGAVINESDLKEALKSKKIAAAALDVFKTEPPTDIELLSLPNLIATSHIGGSSAEGILAMGRSAIENLERLL